MAIYNDKTGEVLLDSQVPFVGGVLPPALEKKYMNPIRFRTNYRIVPGFVILCAVCLALVVILGSIDDQKFMPVMIGLFAVITVAALWLLLTEPKTREKELALELERYDFDYTAFPEQDRYETELEGLKLEFSENGLTVNGQFCWYNHLRPRLVTSNLCNRVWVAVQFGADAKNAVFAPLDPVVLRAVVSFRIPLENGKSLEYLLRHKRNVFAQIYQTGTFTVFDA